MLKLSVSKVTTAASDVILITVVTISTSLVVPTVTVMLTGLDMMSRIKEPSSGRLNCSTWKASSSSDVQVYAADPFTSINTEAGDFALMKIVLCDGPVVKIDCDVFITTNGVISVVGGGIVESPTSMSVT